MIAPVSGASTVSEITATRQTAAASQPQQAILKPDKVSISHQAAHRAAGDVDHDGDSH